MPDFKCSINVPVHDMPVWCKYRVALQAVRFPTCNIGKGNKGGKL